MVDVYIISGFLGAGKTTWIQRLLKEAFQTQKVVLIENDFGQASVDAELLKHQGITVTEISAGCICCSLSGDFIRAISTILKEHAPDVLLIEPSGVGKLSDVIKACEDQAVKGKLHLAGSMTVVDATRFALYQENFGEFFEDQVRVADAVLLSHGSDIPDQAMRAKQMVTVLNPKASLFDALWDSLPVVDILASLPESPYAIKELGIDLDAKAESVLDDECDCGHEHSDEYCQYTETSHHNASDMNDCHTHDYTHAHDCHTHDHKHAAEEIFETLTVETDQIFTRQELLSLFQQMEQNGGNIVRAKGIMRGEKGNWNVQYVIGQLQIERSTAPAGKVAIIGQNLHRDAILTLFQGQSTPT